MTDHKHTPGCCGTGNTLQEALDILAQQPVSPFAKAQLNATYGTMGSFVSQEQVDAALASLGVADVTATEFKTLAMDSHNPQLYFDAAYITSAEICARMGVTRAALSLARKEGYLPNAISLGAGMPVLWERAGIEEHLTKWEAARKARIAQWEQKNQYGGALKDAPRIINVPEGYE